MKINIGIDENKRESRQKNNERPNRETENREKELIVSTLCYCFCYRFDEGKERLNYVFTSKKIGTSHHDEYHGEYYKHPFHFG